MSAPSWFDCTCSSSCPCFAAVSARERDELVERRACRRTAARVHRAGSGSVPTATGWWPTRSSAQLSTPIAANALPIAARSGSSTRSIAARARQHEREPAGRLLVARHDREQIVGRAGRAVPSSAAPTHASELLGPVDLRRRDPLERAREVRRRTRVRSRPLRRARARTPLASPARARPCDRG